MAEVQGTDFPEIVIYESPDNPTFKMEVRVEHDSVWLSQAQLVDLFNSTKQNISLHISNIFREGELQNNLVVKEYLTTASDGKRYRTKFYSLDVIISVGYRVKSHRGTQFRIWANKVLRDYLLKGYAMHRRLEKIERKLLDHDRTFDLLINSPIQPTEGIFFDGQIFDAWQFVSILIKEATTSIVLIDNYIDESVLLLLSKRKTKVTATIYTQNITKQLEVDLQKHLLQYPVIEIKTFAKSHDRFLIIDQKTVYHIGASLKDLGKKWFAFSKINIDAQLLMNRLGDEQMR
ncbi:MAG TPA: RhuM family protein [Bacteroidales bacterium]|nr:RhuM family protein [Bacteroidales bacterium]